LQKNPSLRHLSLPLGLAQSVSVNIVSRRIAMHTHPMSRFWAYLESADAGPSQLPLTHVTDAYTLRGVLEDKTLLAQGECKVFNELLLYFFYGRPAFRVGEEGEVSGLRSEAPVCLVLTSDLISSAKRVIPFDSGGYAKGRFHAAFHKRMPMKDFYLQPSMDAPTKLIKTFFGTNEAYYDAQPLKEVLIPPTAFEAESYHKLITDDRRNKYDNRVSAIEVQIAAKVKVDGHVLAALIPEILLDDSNIRQQLVSFNITPLPYKLRGGIGAREYPALFFDHIRDYLVSSGFLAD
jgi:hypothetical protein